MNIRPVIIVTSALAIGLLLLLLVQYVPAGSNAQNLTKDNDTDDVQAGGIVTNGTNVTGPCLRTFTYCYTGETIMSQDCINGKPVKWVCEPYYVRHNKSTAGIPPQFMYLAEYACYWENRDKFGLAANYHPAAMCEGPIVLGWKESCDCAGYIDLVERSNPQRYYITR